ncbi:MAG: Rrf2 family transcriptional regulator [Bacillota bacterium]|nr:Rrf2 family transcriptional regulator [Bacillota bacterium]MDW7730164.1 Rrf2 family transcriptional regulator [Bacillota bacterium]
MQLSTKVRYAARAMIELAMNYKEEPIQLNDIACKQDISVKYLEQIMAPLRARGYVRTQKGSRGGYHLAVKPDDITLYDIVESVEGTMAPVACVDDDASCDKTNRCVTRTVWIRMKNAIKDELQAKTLAELAAEQDQLNTGI